MKINKIGEHALNFLDNNKELSNKVIDAWESNRRLSHEIKALEITNKAKIEELTIKCQLCRDVLIHVFAERGVALSACYKSLDYALENNDRELIVNSLRGISSIVSQNPLESFNNLVKILDDDNAVLKLDF